jgi:hypothetical protein
MKNGHKLTNHFLYLDKRQCKLDMFESSETHFRIVLVKQVVISVVVGVSRQ